MLYSVVSRKNSATGSGSEQALSAGGVVYSLRLRLNATATPGVVFDGTTTMPAFRAAVRDRLGNDTVSQTDFAIGKLEVR